MAPRSDQTVSEVEFTLDWYETFLRSLESNGYDIRPFSAYRGGGDSLILRHDIDLSIEAALEMARVEAALGIQSSYFVLLTSPVYNPFERDERDRLGAIASLGHDVGLHFSTHEYWPVDAGPTDRDIDERVEEEFDVLETIVEKPAATVSFHDPPSWVLNRAFETFPNAYAPRFFEEMGYVADSGQRWRDTPPDLAGRPEPTQLVAHPGLWGDIDQSFADRIDHHVSTACRRAERRAHREILHGVTG